MSVTTAAIRLKGEGESTPGVDARSAIGPFVGDDWYVYSGNDDPEFASNQHQGLTLPEESFVWECQQILKDGTFDLVVYYEADVDQSALLRAIREAGYAVTGVDAE